MARIIRAMQNRFMSSLLGLVFTSNNLIRSKTSREISGPKILVMFQLPQEVQFPLLLRSWVTGSAAERTNHTAKIHRFPRWVTEGIAAAALVASVHFPAGRLSSSFSLRISATSSTCRQSHMQA